MAELRVAVCGCGFIADLQVRAIRAAGGARVVGVAGLGLEPARAFAARHGIEHATTDWETLVTSRGVDAGLICTPNSLHASQAIVALDAGRAVLVEKPMATSVADGEAMLAAARATGAVLLVGHMWRYRDEVRALRARIDEGDLGRVVRTHGYGVHAGWGPAGWFTRRAEAGGGALVDMGVHAIDTARYLLGDPEPARVVAALGTAYGDYDVDDDGVVLIEWEGGVRSTVESGWWQPHLGGLEADTKVYATGGYARIWPPVEPPGGDHCTLPMYAAQFADFAARCRGAEPTPGGATAEGGLTVLRIVEQAYASAAAA